MTFWLTVIVLDYCESPSDEQGRKSRGRTPWARSLTLQAVSSRGNSVGVSRPWSKEISPNGRAAGRTRSLVMQFDGEVPGQFCWRLHALVEGDLTERARSRAYQIAGCNSTARRSGLGR